MAALTTLLDNGSPRDGGAGGLPLLQEGVGAGFGGPGGQCEAASLGPSPPLQGPSGSPAA